ncbi:hypothetical protein CLV30_12554 [Haloactinopolyspora alba]|uniref:Uncharacterized protein n=1 Tax=Haloactinopolyspora alba TaxID=648780 RepID=A0A2P8DHG9_9ACTN|nr:hypothetical protein [Haloactinopolyspora alba]PSK96672.1 hypothetical protein CLV30_12554 [Haloactinopolyspora alba]
MSAAAVLLGIALAAALIAGTWMARGRVDRVIRDGDTIILDAVWQVCDALGWPGELGGRLREVVDEQPHQPVPDASEIDEPVVGGWTPPRDFVLDERNERMVPILPALEPEGTAS